MKFFIGFALLLSVLCAENEENVDRSMLSIAFVNVTRHLFQLETRMFINNYGVDSDTLTWLLLKNLNKKAMPYQLRKQELKTESVLMASSALMTFNSFDSLRVFNDKLILTNKYFKPLQLFIFCQHASVENIASLTLDVKQRAKKFYLTYATYRGGKRTNFLIYYNTNLWDIIQYEYFLVNEAPFIKLLTFVMYSPEKCGEWHITEVNRFNKLTVKWENDKFSIEKLANFHGCNITLITTSYYWGTYFYKRVPTVLANHLNYKLVYWVDQGDKNALLDFSSRKGCYNVYDRNSSFTNSTRLTLEEIEVYITSPVEFTENLIAVPPSENYSEYEKLSMPFDNSVWALIALTFIAAFLTILILHNVDRTKRDMIIGPNVTSPSLNVTAIFFGISQVVLPQRSFARFLIMSFIVYSLIIRTAWQGKMYEFMQKNVSKPEIQTVEDGIVNGYSFYMEPNFIKKFPESEISKRAKVYSSSRTNDSTASRQEMLVKLLDPKFKGIVQVDPFARDCFAKMSGRFMERLRKEVLYVSMCGMKFQRHHHFIGIFELKTQQLFNGGIVPFRFDLSDNPTYEKESDSGPKVLNMKILEPGFVIWLTTLSLAIISYSLEWLMTFKDLLVIKYVFVAYYRSKERIF